MDNLIIGLLPTVTPQDDMKIAVSGGIHAITIGDLKAYITGSNGSDGGNGGSGVTTHFTLTKADGTVYTDEAPSMTNAELNKGFDIQVTSDYTDPINWSNGGEGVVSSVGNSGYSAHFYLQSGYDYPAGTEIVFTGSMNGVVKISITITVLAQPLA